MKPLARLILAALLSATVAATALGKTPVPSDFAYGLRLAVEGQSALWQLPLPSAIYERVTRSDLGDLRVFNATGQVVSHAIQRPQAAPLPTPAARDLPFFPLHVEHAGSGRVQTLEVQRDPQGRVRNITSNVTPISPGTRISAYLIDVSHRKEPLGSLTLSWAQPEAGFSATVTLEHSADLVAWQPLVSKAGLADLQAGAHRLVHRDITLPASHAAYLRLSWPKALHRLRLTGVQGRTRQRDVQAPQHWTQVSGMLDKTETHTYHFDSGGYWPVDRMRVAFAEPNMVVQVRLLSRPTREATWQQRFRGLVYHLQTDATSLHSDPLVLPVTTDRHWQLQIDAADRSETDLQPTLALGWTPHTLTFAAQGKPPYTLAYGSARVGPSERPVAALLKALGEAETAALVKTAQVGAAVTLGGADRLQPPPRPIPWKHLILWGVLLTGAALLGYMVLRLYRQLNAADGNAGDSGADGSAGDSGADGSA